MEATKTEHILLIDDDPIQNLINCKLIENMKLNVIVDAVHGASSALEKLENEPDYKPRVVFLDINMPRMNGWEFLEHTKDFAQFKDSCIFMLTSSISPEDVRKATAHKQVEQFLTKPLSSTKLKEMLLHVCKAKQDKLNP